MTSKLSLRDYQTKAIDLARNEFINGKKSVLIFMATGSGKSVLFLSLVKSILERGGSVCFVVKRRELIFQAKKHFEKINIVSSIIMGNEKGYNPALPLQICSIDTVIRRKNLDHVFNSTFVIADEAHDCTSESYKKFLGMFSDKTKFIGLTASPFLVGRKGHTFWGACVKPIEMDELRDRGFLVPCDTYIPKKIDLSKVKIIGGDYSGSEIEEIMTHGPIMGNIIDSYKKIGQGRKAICFCVSKKHASIMMTEFHMAGFKSAMIDDSTPKEERDKIIKELKSGELDVITNINILSTGVDIPELEVGIMARPTKSENLWIQSAGRLLRPCRICHKCRTQYDNSPKCPVCGSNEIAYKKEKAILIDHANNTLELGDVYMKRQAQLEDIPNGKKKKSDIPQLEIKTCPECYFVFQGGKECPSCGHIPERERQIKEEDAEMVLYEIKDNQEIILKYRQLLKKESWGVKPNAKWFTLYELYGEIVYTIFKDCPSWVGNIWRSSCPNKCKDVKSIKNLSVFHCPSCGVNWEAKENKKRVLNF